MTLFPNRETPENEFKANGAYNEVSNRELRICEVLVSLNVKSATAFRSVVLKYGF